MALDYPDNLTYFDSHEYALLDGDTVTIGITAYAIDQLGDIVFLELPEVDSEVSKDEECGTIESVKAVGSLISPVSGIVIAINEALVDNPDSLADDPYEKAGWMVKVKIDDPSELENGMSSEDYINQVEGDDSENE